MGNLGTGGRRGAGVRMDVKHGLLSSFNSARKALEAVGMLYHGQPDRIPTMGYFQQRYKTRHRLWTWPAALIMKTVIGTAVSDDAFSVKVVDAITSGDGKVRAYESHFFVVDSTDDR